MAERRFRIVICRGPECGDRRGSAALHDQFRGVIDVRGAGASVELGWQSCFGRCTQGPNVLVRELVAAEPGAVIGMGLATLPGPRGVTALYNRMTEARCEPVVVQHIQGGQIVRDFIERPGAAGIGQPNPVGSRIKK